MTGAPGYPLDALDDLAPLSRMSCGLRKVDALTEGGLWPGAVWTLVAPAGLGVTTLSVQCTVAAAVTTDVLLVNAHMATHLVRDFLRRHIQATNANPAVAARIKVASWADAPRPGDTFWGTDFEDAGLVVLDCVDEMGGAGGWTFSTEDRLARVRWLRELAQRHNTALLLTSRLRPAWTRQAASAAEREHWTNTVFPDVADVALRLYPDSNDRVLEARARGQGSLLVQLMPRPGKALHEIFTRS